MGRRPRVRRVAGPCKVIRSLPRFWSARPSGAAITPQFLRRTSRVNLTFPLILLLAAMEAAAAQAVPLPRARPAPAVRPEPAAPEVPSECRLRLTAELAIA